MDSLQTQRVEAPITFKEFAIFIQANKIREAGMCLSLLLDLSDEKSEAATQFFLTKLRSHPGFFMRLMQLKNEVEQGEQNAALSTLIVCFGIDGPDAVNALKTIQNAQTGGSPTESD